MDKDFRQRAEEFAARVQAAEITGTTEVTLVYSVEDPGGLVGFIANMLAMPVWDKIERRRFRRKYGPLSGEYKGYRLNGDRKAEQVSKASITHSYDNVLAINLTELNGNVWTGEAVMEGMSGLLVWRYEKLNGSKTAHRCGMKRCFYIRGDSVERIYLMGDRAMGYGDELLERACN